MCDDFLVMKLFVLKGVSLLFFESGLGMESRVFLLLNLGRFRNNVIEVVY